MRIKPTIPTVESRAKISKSLVGNKYDLGLNSNGENSWNLPKKIKDLNNINETKKIIQNEIDIMNNFKYD